MALPRSSLPSYANQSFLVPNENQQFTTAQALFFKYHPSLLQQQVLDLALKNAQAEMATEAEQLELLREQNARLTDLRTRYRQTGAGPSGTADLMGASRRGAGRGAGAGRGGLSGDDVLDAGLKAFELELKRSEMGIKAYEAVAGLTKELEDKPRQFAVFEEEFLARERTLQRAGRSAPMNIPAQITQQFGEAAARMGASAQEATPFQRKAAATDLYMRIREMYPETYGTIGQQTPGQLRASQALMTAIDETYQTRNFLSNSLSTGFEPIRAIETEKEREIQRLEQLVRVDPGVAPGVFELNVREKLLGLPVERRDRNGDGRVTPEEDAETTRELAEEARRQLGIGEPLSDEELLALERYVGALNDDGVAEASEFASPEEFEAAKKAYARGRTVENLPRGFAPFYDDTYLDLVREQSSVQRQIGELEASPEDALQRAYRRAYREDLALPRVSDEALAAAAASGGPLAASSMPFAMKRYMKSSGTIEPQDAAERFAQKIIDTAGGDLKFQDFAAQVDKKFKNDPGLRRDALAYYGAYFFAKDHRNNTLAGVASLDLDEALAEAVANAVPAEEPPLRPGTSVAGVPLTSRTPRPEFGPDFALGPQTMSDFVAGRTDRGRRREDTEAARAWAERNADVKMMGLTEPGTPATVRMMTLVEPEPLRPEAVTPEAMFINEATGAPPAPPTTTGLRPATAATSPLISAPMVSRLPQSTVQMPGSFLASPQSRLPQPTTPVTPFTPAPPTPQAFMPGMSDIARAAGTLRRATPDTSGVMAPPAEAPMEVFRAGVTGAVDPAAAARARAAYDELLRRRKQAEADRLAAEEALLMLERAGL